MTEPTPVEAKETPVEEVKPVEPETEPTAQEPESTPPDKEIEFVDEDGNIQKCTPSQAHALLQIGLKRAMEIQSEKNKPEPEPEPEPKEEDRLSVIEKKFNDFMVQDKKEKSDTADAIELTQLMAGDEFLKDYPELVEEIKINTLARKTINTSLTNESAFRHAIAQQKKVVMAMAERSKEKESATNKIKGVLGSISKGSSDVAKINVDEPFTMKDVNSGKSQSLIEEVLKSYEGD